MNLWDIMYTTVVIEQIIICKKGISVPVVQPIHFKFNKKNL